MNYLFFDIETIIAESINPRIVSFGYVLTDERFNVITDEDIFINPQEKTETINNWQWKQDATKDKEGFKAFYHKIKGLLTADDTVIVGHGTGSDVRYLFDECDRFHFEPIDFDYLDTKTIADLLLDADMPKNLKGLHDGLCENRGEYTWHRSLDDARMTKEVFEALSEKAAKANVDILGNDELIFNSLRCIYGNISDVAKRGEEYFSCNFDIPIIGLLVKGYYANGAEKKAEVFKMYYDYALDKFFVLKHPRIGTVKGNSLLPEHAYDIAKRRAIYKINKLWNDTKKRNKRSDFFYREGSRLCEIKIVNILSDLLTSYEAYAAFKGDYLEFDFKVPLSADYLKNAIGYKKDVVVDLERTIKTIHTVATANRSMRLMAKMKFGYKDRNFPNIKVQDLPYSEDVKYLLAKEYFNMLNREDVEKSANDILICGDKSYVPTEHAFDNNLFPDRLVLPVLAEMSR